MPPSESATPTHRAGLIRSWPSDEERRATVTGVQPKMRELFATDVRATPLMKSHW